MAVKSKEELIEILKARIGEDNSDEAISLLEDVSDTLDDMGKQGEGQEDWKKKYEDNDKAWREKYKARFTGHSEEGKKDEEIEEEENSGAPKSYAFEDLFKKEG